jgi:hypothetical protein
MKNLFKILALLFTMGLFVVSCENITDEPQIDEEIAQDNALAGAAIGDVFGATITNYGGKKSVESCPTDSYDGNILTLTYNCTGADAIERTGIVTAEFDPTFGEPGGFVTITFDNFTRGGAKLEGIIVAEHKGYDEMDNPKYNVKSADGTDMVLTFADGKKITWEFNTNYTWTEGWDDRTTTADDVWKVSGTSSGTARSGKTFTRTDTDLTTSPTCPWFVSGTVDLTINDSDELKMEFTACGSVKFTYRGITVNSTF